jgi:uncharacterized protein YlxW (UPF0749 family)
MLSLILFSGFGLTANAQTTTTQNGDIRADRKDIRKDTKDIRSDRRDVRSDVKDRRSDIRDYRYEERRRFEGGVAIGSERAQERHSRHSC